jgi:hypothetical protein
LHLRRNTKHFQTFSLPPRVARLIMRSNFIGQISRHAYHLHLSSQATASNPVTIRSHVRFKQQPRILAKLGPTLTYACKFEKDSLESHHNSLPCKIQTTASILSRDSLSHIHVSLKRTASSPVLCVLRALCRFRETPAYSRRFPLY